MVGVVIIVIVLVIVIPVVVLMSTGVIAAVLGGFLKSSVDAEHEGSELLALSEHYPGARPGA